MASSSPWASEAALNALLRYKPQQEGLADLRRAAEERFAESVQAGKSEGTLASQAATAAVKPTQQVFDSAKTEGERGRGLIAPVLAALAAGSPFATAAANEQAAGGERLAGQRASALSDLKQRKVAAAELPAYTRQSASSTLAAELQKLISKEQSLHGSEQEAARSETQSLRREAKKEALSAQLSREGNQTSERDTAANNRTSREDAELAHPKGGAAAKPLTLAEQNKGVATVQQIKEALGNVKGSRAAKIATLVEGEPAQSHKEPDGSTVKEPAVPAYKPDVLMSAALDWAEYGHLSGSTEHRLKEAGYEPKRLGIPLSTTPRARLDHGLGGVGKKVTQAVGVL